MIESSNTESLNDETNKLSFGESLYVERKRQNLTAAEIASAIHLSEAVIDAIDHSDVSRLPGAAFVQGYLRAYAKHLGISENLILEEYSRAVPHQQESDLQPRPSLPGQASSNTPFVKIITVLLLVVTIIAALYASFEYYKNAIVTDVTESATVASLKLPDEPSVEFEQSNNTFSSEEGENFDLPEALTDTDKQKIIVNTEKEKILVPSSEKNIIEQKENDLDQKRVVSLDDEGNISNVVAEGEEILELVTEEVSWVEVEDANGVNLYYNLMQQGQQINLQGSAPFKVFLGDAPQVQVKINDIDVNIKKYIRIDKNTAYFKISVDQQQVVFH